ncbi:TELO2-interacting protein 2 [Pseudophryne corroboree]|uniref:TELO2-interacting protein 2 n=1 Tax=Pseudophryne corroboree TaxID=495146 RepID=UPI0030817615
MTVLSGSYVPGMAAQEQLLAQALTDLSACLGRSTAVPCTLASCAELLQAVVAWAAPGTDPGSEQGTPGKAAAAARAFAKLLEAARAASRDGDSPATAPGDSAGAELPTSVTSENAEAPGKSASLVVQSKSGWEGVVAPTSPEDGDEAPGTKEAPRTNPDISGVGPMDPQYVLRCATVPVLLLCGAHIQDKPWTDCHSRALAKQLLQTLLEVLNFKSVADLIKGNNQDLPFSTFREALGLLGPLLCKDTWESHPEAKLVFSWMLYQVPRPWLSDFLSRVMPPSLLFSDDYKPENKVLGICCLHHIIKNVPAADLRQYNRAMVVYHALRNHLYTTDAEVIEVALPCLLDLFPVLQKPPPAVGAYQKDAENPSDQVLQLVLTHMEMEHKIVMRRLYARNLPALQERLGVRVVRHMKRLLRVIVSYLEVYDGPEETARLCILDTLQGTIKYAWPRIPSRLPLLLKALLKLIYEVSSDPSQHSLPVREALLHSASDCLVLLDRCCQGQVKIALEGIPAICNEPLLVKCINRVLHDT